MWKCGNVKMKEPVHPRNDGIEDIRHDHIRHQTSKCGNEEPVNQQE
jgi:hypothetical protein